MAVISPHKAWPDSRVPYVADTPETAQWLLEINRVIGFPLLVEKGISDSDFVNATKGARGGSETIGYVKGKGAHGITGSHKATLQHELMHALGFHHEQLHAKGPWGAFGTRAATADRIDKKLLESFGANMVPAASRIAIPVAPSSVVRDLESASSKKAPVETGAHGHARRSSISSGEVLKLAVNAEAMEQHLRAYQEALSDRNIVHMGDCDFDSVMMYGEMTLAARSLKLTMVNTGRMTLAPHLSNGDVQALKHLYTCKILIVA